MSFKEQVDQLLNNYISGLTQAGAVTALAENFSKNITFQGGCKDWESLPNTASAPGNFYWIHDTGEIAVWTGTYWVRMDSTLDPGLIPEWYECSEVFHSPGDPFRPKTEEEKLDELADALTLLAL